MSLLATKLCTKCGQSKVLDEFSRAPRGRYGRKSTCKSCDASRHAAQYVPKPRAGRSPDKPLDTPKRCTRCGAEKTLAEFSLSRGGTNNRAPVYRSACKTCQAAQALAWFNNNRERALRNQRRLRLATEYGITQQGFHNLLASQGGVCAICGQDEPIAHGRTGRQFQMAVDHCHRTGRIRGLLCQRCNRALGLLRDDPVVLRRAISYLLRNEKGAAEQGGQ